MNDSEALRAIIVSTLLEILESPLDVRKMIKAIATFQPFLRFWTYKPSGKKVSPELIRFQPFLRFWKIWRLLRNWEDETASFNPS